MSGEKEKQFKKRLAKLRLQIDTVDRALIKALARRSQIVDKIGVAKKAEGAQVVQKSRWNQLVKDRTRFAASLGVDKKLIHRIFECIQKESISRQARAKSKGKKP